MGKVNSHECMLSEITWHSVFPMLYHIVDCIIQFATGTGNLETSTPVHVLQTVPCRATWWLRSAVERSFCIRLPCTVEPVRCKAATRLTQPATCSLAWCYQHIPEHLCKAMTLYRPIHVVMELVRHVELIDRYFLWATEHTSKVTS